MAPIIRRKVRVKCAASEGVSRLGNGLAARELTGATLEAQPEYVRAHRNADRRREQVQESRRRRAANATPSSLSASTKAMRTVLPRALTSCHASAEAPTYCDAGSSRPAISHRRTALTDDTVEDSQFVQDSAGSARYIRDVVERHGDSHDAAALLSEVLWHR